MSRESLVLILGIVVVAVPHMGVPTEWKEWIILGAGLLLVAIGYSLRRSAFFRSIEVAPGEHRGDAFVEHAHHTTHTSHTRI